MSLESDFDPYYKWLGIPPQHQPPNYYRLLSVEMFETDQEVIRAAAERQMGHVQNYKIGPNSELSQRLLNELARAKVCLSNSHTKAEYDEKLRRQLREKERSERLPVSPKAERPVLAPPAIVPPPEENWLGEGPAPVDPSFTRPRAKDRRKARRSADPFVVWGILGLAGLSIAAIVLLMLRSGDGSVDARSPPAAPPSVANSRIDKSAKKKARPINSSDVNIDRKTAPPVTDLKPVVRDVKPMPQPARRQDARPQQISRSAKPTLDQLMQAEEQLLIPENSLPQGLLRRAEACEDPTKRWILLHKCIAAAIDRDDEKTALDAIEQVALHFDADGFKLADDMRTKLANRRKLDPRPPEPAPAETRAARRLVPSRAEQDRAWASVEAAFAEQSKDMSLEGRQRLARSLLEKAENFRQSPTGYFVMLQRASEAARQAGDLRFCFEAIDAIERSYEYDGLLQKADHVINDGFDSTPGVVSGRDNVIAALDLLDQLAAAEEFDRVTQVHNRMKRSYKGDDMLSGQAETRYKEISVLKSAHDSFKANQKRLKDTPDDPGQNLAVGRYLCGAKNQWDKGLPMLAKGSDPVLKKLAQDELANPGTAEELANIGDRWLKVAQKPPQWCQLKMREHAVALYRRALPNLVEPRRADVEKRAAIAQNDEMRRGEGKSGKFSSIGSKQMQLELLNKYGGDQTTEHAVEKGLEWLVKQQKPDGSWSLSGPYADGSKAENIPAATAMALLAFQGHGDTHREGKHAKNVAHAWNALLKMQRKDGLFSGVMTEKNQLLYTHAQCTIAICELYGMTRDSTYRGSAERAIQYAIGSQSKELGGWRYTPGEDTDTSVTGWFVMALQSARMAKLKVPEETLNRISAYLDTAQSENGQRYGYWMKANMNDAMAADGLLCRQYLGWRQDDPRLVAGVGALNEKPVAYDGRFAQDVYYWYYATQATHHMEGKIWDDWNKVMRQEVPAHQVKEGPQSGSWNPQGDKWGTFGGRLYVTCLSIYMLEVYYRHLPIYSDHKIVASVETAGDPAAKKPPSDGKPPETAGEKPSPDAPLRNRLQRPSKP